MNFAGLQMIRILQRNLFFESAKTILLRCENKCDHRNYSILCSQIKYQDRINDDSLVKSQIQNIRVSILTYY